MSDNDLIGFIEKVQGTEHLRVEEDLGSGFVRLRTAEAERRQAKHDIRCVEDIVIEMLRNARDAQATAVFIATAKEGSTRSLTFIDDGVGIPDDLQGLIFEPRVTSKLETMVSDHWGVHGRGMALFSIKCNVSEARVVWSRPGFGTALHVSVDTGLLPEKTDQSTFPQTERDEDGEFTVARGPRNIIRNALEFALAHRAQAAVYLGPPSEVAATLIQYGRLRMTPEALLGHEDIESLPLCERLAACVDASELLETCLAMGLVFSERTAHRILGNQIQPLKPLIERVLPAPQPTSAPRTDLTRDNRGLKIAQDDLEVFSRELERAFEDLAQRYYLSPRSLPAVKVSSDAITVRFPFEKEI